MADGGPGEHDWASWETPLRRFAAATGLTVSAWDAEGRRQLGPFVSTRLGEMLAASPLWSEDGPGAGHERLLVTGNGDTLSPAFFGDAWRVQAMPLSLYGRSLGAIVFGWVLADFASAMGCERLAGALGISGRALWSVARLESPVSERRMATYTALLATIIDSGLGLREAIERLEDLGRARELFLAHVSHDLRTPLASAAMRLELLLSGPLDKPAEIRAALESVRARVGEEAGLINDLLDAAVTRTGRFTLSKEPADLAQIARHACDAIAPLAEGRGVRLRLRGADRLPLSADASRLQQALWNLIANAVKFSPAGGSIEVDASATDAGYEVRVADEGPGIDPAVLPRLFEPFARRREDNAQGLGLGLSIARQIAQLHGGDVTVEPRQEGPGTVFILHLPASS